MVGKKRSASSEIPGVGSFPIEQPVFRPDQYKSNIAQEAIATAVDAADTKETLVWTKDMEYILFSHLLEQQELGKRADTGFKKEAWVIVSAAVQNSYRGPLTITLKQLKNKECAVKALFRDWVFLRDQSGFRWNKETQMIKAAPQA
jgi:hypothetical protein